ETGQGGLGRHGLGQPQRVGQPVPPVRVVLQAAAADGLAPLGGVHGDDDREAGAPAAFDDDAFVIHFLIRARVQLVGSGAEQYSESVAGSWSWTNLMRRSCANCRPMPG